MRPYNRVPKLCVGADTIRPRQLPSFYGWWQPARFPPSSRKAFPALPGQRQRRGSEVNGFPARAGFDELPTGTRPRRFFRSFLIAQKGTPARV